MSEVHRAVFLSYASQDAEAARRIADTLRAAGLEVWFDQNELVGGDAWDQKIRRQIQSCALFVPIISANTQSRTEGYFRLEWRLAEQRTHLMAKGRPFLVPIVIDGTSDTEAHVPDGFLEVQWSRFPGGACDERFGARMQQLLTGDIAVSVRPATKSDGHHQTAPRQNRRVPRWSWAALTAVLAGAAVAIWGANLARQHSAESAPVPSVVLTNPADELVAKARALLDDDPLMTRANVELAEQLSLEAMKLDPTNAEAYAVAAWTNFRFLDENYEDTPQRRADLRAYAEKARLLAPDSVNAELAMCGLLIQTGDREAAGARLRALADRAPDNFTVLNEWALISTWGRGADWGEDGNNEPEAFARLRAFSPRGQAQAAARLAGRYWARGEYAEADRLLDPLFASGNLTKRAYLARMLVLTFGWGDLKAAQEFVATIPSKLLLEDVFINHVSRALSWAGDYDQALAVLNRTQRPMLHEVLVENPTAMLRGNILAAAGRPGAAAIQWREALKLVNEKLAGAPDNARLLEDKAELLIRLGDKAAAQQVYSLIAELRPGEEGSLGWAYGYDHYVLLGDYDAAVARLDRLIAKDNRRWPNAYNGLRYDPSYADFRKDSRVQAILARVAEWMAEMRREANSTASAATGPTGSDKSVAVLAFANLSDDKDNEYFSDGISEELLNVLAKIPGLKVTARTSAFLFKGKQVSVADIAQQLGVAYVVEGSVRKAGERVRISAQLIKASDGFNVWSDSFDRDLKDIFAVQDEIAGRIARELSSRLGVAANAISGTGGTKSVEAYEAFLKGRAAWSQRTYSSNQEAVRFFQQAIALDPGYALAHGALAEGYVTLSINGVEPADKVFPLAKASAERALELDPNIVQAYTALAEYCFHYARDYEESDREIERALAVDPNYAVAYSRYSGHLICRNRLEEALAMDERSIALNPLGPEATNSWTLVSMKRYDEALESARRESAPDRFPLSGRQTVGLIQFLTGHGEEAVKTLEGVVRDFPEETDPLTYLGWVYGQVGQTAKAREILQRMMAMSESRYVSPLEMAKVAAGMNDREQAFAQLERAFERREPELPTVGASRFLDPIRDDPRFREMLKRLKLDVYFPKATQP